MVAELHILEQIRIPLLDWSRPLMDPLSLAQTASLPEARGGSAGIVLVHCIGMFCDNIEKFFGVIADRACLCRQRSVKRCRLLS